MQKWGDSNSFISSNTNIFLSSICLLLFLPLLFFFWLLLSRNIIFINRGSISTINSFSHSPGLRNSGSNYSDQVHLIDPLTGHSPEIPDYCWPPSAGDSLDELLSVHSAIERWLLAIVVVVAADFVAFDCWQSAPKKDSGSLRRI